MFLLKYKKQIVSLIILLSLFCFSAYSVFAIDNLSQSSGVLNIFGTRSGYETGKVNIKSFIGSLIQYLLSFLGVIFLVLLIYGGYSWMQARGDTEAVQESKDTMINAGAGLAIVLGAYLITNYIIVSLVKETLQVG